MKPDIPKLFPGVQVRSLKKANYVERIRDSESAEDLLEAMEVRQDEKNVPPQRQVLNEDGSGKAESEHNEEVTAHLTKGMNTCPQKMNW